MPSSRFTPNKIPSYWGSKGRLGDLILTLETLKVKFPCLGTGSLNQQNVNFIWLSLSLNLIFYFLTPVSSTKAPFVTNLQKAHPKSHNSKNPNRPCTKYSAKMYEKKVSLQNRPLVKMAESLHWQKSYFTSTIRRRMTLYNKQPELICPAIAPQ